MTIKDKIIEFMRTSAYNPMLEGELAEALDINREQIPLFTKLLEEMVTEGLVIRTRKKRYGVPERMGLIVGKLQGHAKGFGFIISETMGVEDVFIPASFINGAMNQDRVVARINQETTNTRRAEGEIIRILERANTEVVGVYEDSKNFGFVVPDDKKINVDIFIPKADKNSAKTGDKVVCEIIEWPERRRNPEGKIIEILGHEDDPETDILGVMRKFKLNPNFPKKVEKEIEETPQKVTEEEIAGRKDLRNLTMITIDGADAKDLDDAVSLEKLSNGNYKLGVHIADVAHYVREGTELNKEALKRGTSVYLVDRVIPMLPKELSNGICSLNPRVDRLAMSVFMEIDKQGQVIDHQIFESVININERMVYEDVSDILENDDLELSEKYKHLLEIFKNMGELCKILRNRRELRGSIDFDLDEAKIILNKEGKTVDVIKYERRIANRIIEEFMLICNETIAENFYWLNAPFVYRVHEEPNIEKLEEFNKFIYNLGYQLKGMTNEIHPKMLQDLLKEVEGEKEETLISTLMLRSLKKARYAPENLGHFGLSAKYYCHFTSPIRRYPDLAIHRIIKGYLQGNMDEKNHKKFQSIVGYISEESSRRENLADEAERETEDLKKAEYMAEHIGEIYEGIISGVTSFGIFVELENTIEGMVHLSSIVDDYYIYNADKHSLVGERKKRIFRIGDNIKIQVARVDIKQREIDFNLAPEEYNS